MLYPLKFKPICQPRIWGGRRLFELFGPAFAAPPAGPVGESWQLSPLAEGESAVAAGPLAGTTLNELVRRFGSDLLGGSADDAGRFPLLIKLLDARQNLSVQVHPDAAAAAGLGGGARPKTEAWYVIDAEPGAGIWIGLAPGVGREEFTAAARAGRVGELLHREPAKSGDTFFLPAGTVHALGGGIVVAEVQTPSDTTYRVFDWNRTDPATGRPRAMHLDQALESIHYAPPAARMLPGPRTELADADATVTQLVRCEYFGIERLQLAAGSARAAAGGRMAIWQAIGGGGRVEHDAGAPVEFVAGELVLLPASAGAARVVCDSDCTLLEITAPPR